MKKIKRALVCALLLFLTASPFEAESRDNFSMDYDLTYLDKFVWRGIPWIDDPVLWATINTRWKGFRVHSYFNLDLTDFHESKCELTEFEYTLDYTFHINKFSIAPGYMEYTSLNNLFDTERKIVFDIKANTFLNPYLNMKFDFAGVKGSWGFF